MDESSDQTWVLITQHGAVAGFKIRPRPTRKHPARRDSELWYGTLGAAESGRPPALKFAEQELAEATATVLSSLLPVPVIALTAEAAVAFFEEHAKRGN